MQMIDRFSDFYDEKVKEHEDEYNLLLDKYRVKKERILIRKYVEIISIVLCIIIVCFAFACDTETGVSCLFIVAYGLAFVYFFVWRFNRM